MENGMKAVILFYVLCTYFDTLFNGAVLALSPSRVSPGCQPDARPPGEHRKHEQLRQSECFIATATGATAPRNPLLSSSGNMFCLFSVLNQRYVNKKLHAVKKGGRERERVGEKGSGWLTRVYQGSCSSIKE